ncbi:glycerol-3-phosphate 1-O-acyltransferase PlsY [Candidatus Albibeggiatoa sp. nov. NOAA]|uniref:glycerol-3-phosphate 1-O-acyltransferase PlsY n=1 Tax=Candidatus Albibeggiatoa sp. nov. NOAA TaxID=3162724 RepID=UPI0032FE0994|nr:glycerol-3-phosphate 1-O-acyltransferase PlsY [Thiotrichaceae bacterium]
MLIDISLVVVAYLLGSFSSAVVVCKVMGYEDPRTLGSGNPGATNVLRHGGKKAAIITLILDMMKGVVAVLLAKLLTDSSLIVALSALAVFLGHLYPIFFNFKGGKGVATALGVLLALHWMVGVGALLTWLVMAFSFRYSSLAALITAAMTPVYMYWFSGVDHYVIVNVVITVLIFWRHQSNIQKLMNGTEGKIKFSSSSS